MVAHAGVLKGSLRSLRFGLGLGRGREKLAQTIGLGGGFGGRRGWWDGGVVNGRRIRGSTRHRRK